MENALKFAIKRLGAMSLYIKVGSILQLEEGMKGYLVAKSLRAFPCRCRHPKDYNLLLPYYHCLLNN
ncbi:hypothetical protein LB504_010310 [Fusarium proliferatum]|nr:hypothetical protein LB504_010310 [Fusarium proliferatum]